MKTFEVKGKEVTIDYIANWVKSEIDWVNEGGKSQYLNVIVYDGDDYGYVKIRVSDHSAKRYNNSDSELTLSFVTARCDQGYGGMINEWMIEDEDTLLTDTHEYVEDIIEYELTNNVKFD